jgi:Carboxypeptidase regulatory-like domain
MKSRLLSIAAAVFMFSLPIVTLAQDTAQITGTVTDPSGAAIPNAQVKVSNDLQGFTRTAPTNASGDYLFAAIPVGTYDVTVTAQGFKKYLAKGVTLRVGQKARVDVAMEVGTTNTEVTVEGTDIAQVETQSSDLSGALNSREVSQLELNGRDFKQLITLVPGVSNQTGSDEGQVGVAANNSYSVNGGRVEYNNWEIDGGDIQDNGSNNTINVTPSIDAIGEFKVLTSNYGAQYGRDASGTIEVETKSGTSSFHGDAYEFVRNTIFNSPGFLQYGVAPPYHKNDFGYTIGGPLYIPKVYNENKQKTFFFFSQEWRRDRIPTIFDQAVPSAAERAGNFADQCPNPVLGGNLDCPQGVNAQGNTVNVPNIATSPLSPCSGCPSFASAFAANNANASVLMNALVPLPSLGTPQGGSPGQEFYYDVFSQPTNWREELVRIDHNLTDKQRITFNYIHDSWETLNPIPLWTNVGSFPTIQTQFNGPGTSAVLRLASTFSPTLLNEFVFAYTADHIYLQNTGNWQRPANLTAGQIFPGANRGVIPGINLNDPAGIYGGFGEDPGITPNGKYNANPTYGIKDNVSKIIGKHNLQFGGYLEWAQKNELGGELGPGGFPGYFNFNPSTSNVTSGNPVADMELGYIASFGQQNTQIKYYNRYKIFEPYMQDDWRATPRLTLNLGLRMSFFGTYRERYHQAFNFDPTRYKQGVTAVAPDDTVSKLGITNPTGPISIENMPNGMVQCGVAGEPPGCQTDHHFNPAPRVGFAFDPKGDGKWAIRAGYGIFFEHTNGNEANTESLENSPPLAYAAQQVNIPGYATVGSAKGQAAPQLPLSPNSIQTNLVWPNVQQWHLDVQHDVWRNLIATVSYVGSSGTHLGRQLNLNQLQPVSQAVANSLYGPGVTFGANDCNNPDKYGVPQSGVTPSGHKIPYTVNPATGLATGPAVNVAVADGCIMTPDPFRPYPGYSNIDYLENAASSNYNALQVNLRRSVGSLQTIFAYTYSHSIDDSSDRYDASFVNSYNPSANRGSSNYDQRHMINFAWIWDTPFFKNPGVLNKILGGWQYSGIMAFATGSPFGVYYPTDNAGVANGIADASSYADIVGNPRTGVVNNASTIAVNEGPLFYNGAAYAAPEALTFGDSGRNSLSNPDYINFNMGVFKHFKVTEGTAFEFRTEAFNVFNHTEWLPIAGNEGSGANNNPGTPFNNTFGPVQAGFLHAGGAHEARVLQFALKFLF